jgi:DNA-binding GntR family transcriptional regulator
MMSRIHHEASLSDDVYYQLKDYILSDVTHPAERMQISLLSEHFGVSITPIREALIRLSAEALIELRPGRGFFYKEFVPAEQIALYDAMFCVLKYSIENGGARSPVRFLYEMKALLPAQGEAQPSPQAVHTTVLAAEKLVEQIAVISGNPQLVGLTRSLCERTRISRLLDFEQPGNAALIVNALKQLVLALQHGDGPAAITILRDMIDKKRARMSELASERRRRLYAAHPLLQPGAGRHVVVRYHDRESGNDGPEG